MQYFSYLQSPHLYEPWSTPVNFAYGDLAEGGPSATDEIRKIDLLQHSERPGKADVAALRASAERMSVPFAVDATRIICDEKYARQKLERTDLSLEQKEAICERSWRTQTRTGFYAAIILLITWGLLVECGEEEITSYSKYFQVPKGDLFWRVILDSRIAGRLCINPPSVNFPLIRTLLIEIASLPFKDNLYAITGDWKFWFYQIAVNPFLQSLFGLAVSDPKTGKQLFAKVRCLPMGWPYSPRLAQCLGWMCILHREPGEDSLGVCETWTDDPPQFIRLRSSPEAAPKGFIFLWLDNVLVITWDQSLRDLWFARLQRNAKVFNVVWKDLKSTSSPCYLGIFMRFVKTEGFTWCHEAARLKKWKDIVKAPINTVRDVARHVGVAVWHQLMALEPLYYISPAIEVMRRLHRIMKSKSDWDRPLAELGAHLSEAEIATLRQEVRRAIKNPRCSLGSSLPVQKVYACTDACTLRVPRPDPSDSRKRQNVECGGGWLWFGESAKQYQFGTFDWSDEERNLAIHILEARAVYLFMKDILPPAMVPTRLILGVDNTIVVSALGNGYCSCAHTKREIRLALETARQKNYVVEVLWVPSKENAADPPSRGETPDDTRNLRTWEILHGAVPLTQRKNRPSKPMPQDSEEDVPCVFETELLDRCLDDLLTEGLYD